jgi:hypothetical protein
MASPSVSLHIDREVLVTPFRTVAYEFYLFNQLTALLHDVQHVV